MKPKARGRAREPVSDGILQAVGKIIPGFHGFFKKMESSKTFGARVSGIRKEIEKRFGKK